MIVSGGLVDGVFGTHRYYGVRFSILQRESHALCRRRVACRDFATGAMPNLCDADRPNDGLLPVGLGSGQVWLHLGCSAAWRAARKAEAVAAAAMGIRGPEGSST
jgi:hypothetical protein